MNDEAVMKVHALAIELTDFSLSTYSLGVTHGPPVEPRVASL
jgi:hypothetical protein